MADNVQLSLGTEDGVILAGAVITFSGDSSIFQICGGTILTGSEGAWTQTIIVGGAGAVTGGVQRVTLASDDPAVALLGTIDTDTGNIVTSVQLIDDAIHAEGGALSKGMLIAFDDGTDAQFAQANASGHLKVDIATDTVGIGGGTQYAVDAALGATPTGTLAIAIRDDTLGALTPVEGDAIGLRVDANGALWVIPSGTVTVDGSGVTQPVSGTVTANAGTGFSSIAVVGGGVEATALRVTIANDSTGVLSIDDNGGALTVDNGGTFAVQSTLQAGTAEIGKLAAGTAGIGKLTANDGVDIGDVDVTDVIPGTAATNLGKARASALGATDTGVAPLAVRNDDLADLAGADADYTPLQVDNQGALYVNQGMAEMKQASGVAVGGAPGTDDMVAAVGGKKLVICALALFATSTTTNNVFVDNVDNDLIANTGNPIALSIDADGDTIPGFVLPFNPGGWCKTDAVNEAITLNSSAAQDIVWCITYFETD